MHLLIIILQQLLGLLPNGEGKKAPQVELARPPRQTPPGADPSPCLGFQLPAADWMTMVTVVCSVDAAILAASRAATGERALSTCRLGDLRPTRSQLIDAGRFFFRHLRRSGSRQADVGRYRPLVGVLPFGRPPSVGHSWAIFVMRMRNHVQRRSFF